MSNLLQRAGSAVSFTGSFHANLAGARSPLAHSGSSSSGNNIRKRLPSPEEVFFEGYLYRKTRALLRLTNKWSRMFCILQHGTLLFHPSFSSLTDDTAPQFTFSLTENVINLLVVNPTPQANYWQLALECPQQEQVWLSFDTEVERNAWRAVIELELARQRGQFTSNALPMVRARFYEGYLFKTPPTADRWEERWFELNGRGELTYSASFAGAKRGMIDLETCKIVPNATDATGVCSPYYFQIHTFESLPGGEFRKRVYNLAAPTQLEYLNWLKALKVWVGVKRPEPFGSQPPGAAGEQEQEV